MTSPSRRDFARALATVSSMATLTSFSMASEMGSSESPYSSGLEAPLKDPLRVGVIGTANRGGQLMDALLEIREAEIVALCDVDQLALDKAQAKLPKRVDQSEDFRRLLDRKDIDAIVIATPDHWHAIQMVEACKAGKDVYVEKPLSVTIHEGRTMVQAARKYQRVVQVGTHRRSSPLYQKMTSQVADGLLGKVTVARAYRVSNMAPYGIGRKKPSNPPKTLQWDLWLGPRAEQPYQENIAPYKFRWWQNYSSQMGNWGVHYLDAIRWCLREEAPTSICAMGGNFAVDDDRTIPDTMESCFQFKSGRLAIFGQYEASGTPVLEKGDIELRGTEGTMLLGERNYEIYPSKAGQFSSAKSKLKPTVEEDSSATNHSLTVLHMRNWIECIQTRRQPMLISKLDTVRPALVIWPTSL